MLWVPHKGVLLQQNSGGVVGATAPGTVVTTGGVANTKGAVTQLIASTNFDTYWMTVIVSNHSATVTASQACLDILVGAATEKVLIANLLAGYAGGDNTVGAGAKRWDFPIYIPAGTRIAAQCAGARVSSGMSVLIFLYGGAGYPPWPIGTKVVTYGIGTVPDGTAITPGATGAVGAYAQIVASTTEDHLAIVPSFQLSGVTVATLKKYFVEIGIGAATEETLGGFWYMADTNEKMEGPWNGFPLFNDIPTGTRLAMRASASGGIDTGYNGALHCVS